jgi:hypothetical protein
MCFPELILPTMFLYMSTAGLWYYQRMQGENQDQGPGGQPQGGAVDGGGLRGEAPRLPSVDANAVGAEVAQLTSAVYLNLSNVLVRTRHADARRPRL